MTDHKTEEFYTVDDVKTLYGVSRSTLDRRVKRGELKRYKFGAKTLFSVTEIKKLITVAEK
jgi:excisionase family DNA binding protein